MTNIKLLLRFALPFVVWLFIYYESVADMVSVWSNSKTYEHGFLILPISLWVLWHDRQRITYTSLSTAWLPVVLLIFPCLLWMVGKTAGIALFEHVAAVTSLQLIIWAIIGNPMAKAFYFPILYLMFCIPFGEELIPTLQFITADISVAAVQLTGIPIYREGLYLTIPNGKFEVAEACSGIRFLISSIALATLFAYMFFQKWWKQLAFIAFSVVFPIIANGIRAYGIIIVGHYSDMKHATGADHLVYGWFFFAIVITIIFFIASFFADKPTSSDSKVQTERNSEPVFKTNSVIASSLAVLVVIGIWEKSVSANEYSVNMDVQLPVHELTPESSLWGISYPRAKQSIRATTLDGRTELFSARYSLNQQDGELIGYENQLYDKNRWALSLRKKVTLRSNNTRAIPAYRVDVIDARGKLMRILYWYCIDSYCSNNTLKLKLYKASRLMSGHTGHADVKALASTEATEDELTQLANEWVSMDSGKE